MTAITFKRQLRVACRTVTASRLAIAMGASLVLACGTQEAPGPLEPTGALGRIRFVNLITDPARNPVNVSLEGVPFGVNLAYTGTTPTSLPAPSTAAYAAVLAGTRTLLLKRTADTTVTVASLSVAVGAGEDRSVYAVGGTGGSAVIAIATSDTNSVPASGQGRVRIINLSPSAGAIDVFVTAAGANLATTSAAATNVAYRGTSAYLALPAGTYQVRAVPAGTAPADRAGAISVTLSTLALASGAAFTVVTADNTTGGMPRRAFTLRDR